MAEIDKIPGHLTSEDFNTITCDACGALYGSMYRAHNTHNTGWFTICGACLNDLKNREAEELEERFIAALRAENDRPDGFGLVDDGTMDAVLLCPKCDGWLRFDGREAAIDFLESDRECWLCDTESED